MLLAGLILPTVAFIVLLIFGVYEWMSNAYGPMMTHVTPVEPYWMTSRKQEVFMLPKDLLIYLEKGDRTMEDLKDQRHNSSSQLTYINSIPHSFWENHLSQISVQNSQFQNNIAEQNYFGAQQNTQRRGY